MARMSGKPVPKSRPDIIDWREAWVRYVDTLKPGWNSADPDVTMEQLRKAFDAGFTAGKARRRK